MKIAYVLATAILGFGCCAPSFGQGGSSTLAATAAASLSANVNSPALIFNSNYWDSSSSSSKTDIWSIIDVLGTGSNPSSALQITHTGTGGVGVVQAPMFQATGSGAGGFIFTGGSAPTLPSVASTITIYAPMTTFTTYGLVLPNAGATGIPHWSFTSPTVIESVGAITGTDCPTCVTSSSSLTSGNVVVGAGSQAASTTSTLQVGTATPDVTVNQITSGDTMLLLKEATGSTSGNMLDVQTNGGTHEFSVSQAGAVTNYQGSATQGVGVPFVLAVKNNTVQSGSLGTQTIATPSQGGEYRIGYYVAQHDLCSSGTATTNIVFSWTDSQTGTVVQRKLTSTTFTLVNTTNSTNAYTTGNVYINVASSTAITYITNYSVCTGGTYDVFTSLERIQ